MCWRYTCMANAESFKERVRRDNPLLFLDKSRHGLGVGVVVWVWVLVWWCGGVVVWWCGGVGVGVGVGVHGA